MAKIINERTGRSLKESDSEYKSWNLSIAALLRVLEPEVFDNIRCLVEYQLPNGDERADLILLGGTQANKRGLVIELKQWSSFTFDDFTGDFIIPGIGRQRNPAM